MNNFDNTAILKLLENKDLRIFFSGIGGVSMSSIAAVLHHRGYRIGGSDTADNATVKNLKELGIEIFSSHSSDNLKDYDLLVYTSRIKADNPEMIYAKANNIPAIKRSKMLGVLIAAYKTSIGISGTHGKSTASSMTSAIFIEANKDPAFFIGAIYPPTGSTYQIGNESADYCIIESDEYTDSFLDFYPDIAVILNIEMDHPDYFSDISAVKDSFKAYLKNTKKTAVINADDINVLEVSESFSKEIITYGIKNQDCDMYAKNIIYNAGYAEFDIYADKKYYASIKLSVPGEFNIYNSMAAAACAYICGIDGETVAKALNGFRGAGRRFELKGTINNANVYEDYAHHPTAVKKTLTSMKNFNCNKIWCVIQPHTYSRTHELLDDLIESLSYADNIILKEIYSASEVNIYNISSKDIAQKIDNAIFIDDFNEIAEHLKNNVREDDIVVVMGAGDINKLFEYI